MENTTVKNLTYAVVAAIILGGLFLVYRTFNPVKSGDSLSDLAVAGQEEQLDEEVFPIDGDSTLGTELDMGDNRGAEVIDESQSEDELVTPKDKAAPSASSGTTGSKDVKPKDVKPKTEVKTKAPDATSTVAPKVDKKKEKMSGSTATPAAAGYFVQAGKFQSQANADKMVATMKAAGFDNATATDSGSGFVVGASFADKAAANAAKTKMKAAGVDCIVKAN